jgi:hypothetical protein
LLAELIASKIWEKFCSVETETTYQFKSVCHSFITFTVTRVLSILKKELIIRSKNMMPQLLYLNTGIFVLTKDKLPRLQLHEKSISRNIYDQQYRTHRIKRTGIKQLNNHHWRKSIKFPVLTTKIVFFYFAFLTWKGFKTNVRAEHRIKL